MISKHSHTHTHKHNGVQDDMRAWTGAMGYAEVQTPNMDRLSKRGECVSVCM
jgi:hypothetical protein